MFAGINEIDDVLQDRTVRIPLLRKKDDEAVQRYKATTKILESQRQIRDDLYVFALTYAGQIAEFYHKEGEDGIEGMGHLNNRELDIWEPIFLLANVVDSQRGTRELTDMMTELSKTSAAEKQADNVTQNDTYKILGILQTMMADLVPIEDENGIQTFEALQVFEYFKQTEDFGWLKYSNALTGKLKKVKVHSTQKRFSGDKKRVYYFKVKDIEDLCERFKI